MITLEEEASMTPAEALAIAESAIKENPDDAVLKAKSRAALQIVNRELPLKFLAIAKKIGYRILN